MIDRAKLAARLLAAASVLAPTLLLASLFPLPLMLAATTAAGGDLGSHNYAAAVARDFLFTRHQLTGWVPGNFCGFPLFQMYFPLPFVLSTAISLLVNPLVAFKLTSVAGILALPAAAFYCLSARGVPRPGPHLAASLVVPFLMQSGNSAWGGNLQSTMAGEFVFSISLPLALVYLAWHRKAFESTRAALVTGGIVALVALTHAYTALWVALTAALTVPLGRRPAASTMRLATVFGLGGALCAFWLVPLLWYSPWTTAFKHLWVIGSIVEVVPRLLWPAIAIAMAAPAMLWWLDRAALRGYWSASGLLWAGVAAAVLSYVVAPNFGVVDVRFLPFAQLMISLLAAVGAGFLLRRVTAHALWIPIVFLGIAIVTRGEADRISGWVRWNYEGFERKALWPVYRGIADRLRGTAADPRVVYEHSPENEVLGTVRAFENLPLFSGRSTLEGVNFQASVTAPFVFYVQSEISELMSCPFAEWGCSRPALEAGIEHLAMMNVSDVIVRSAAMKAAAARTEHLAYSASVGPYDLYEVTGYQRGYAVPLAMAPYVVETKDWKVHAYQWFKRARATDPVPVFVTDPATAPDPAFARHFDAVPPPDPATTALAGAGGIEEQIDGERITVRGLRPGQPLLVRVSFHPRWRSTTGERVWLAGPGFMLVVPSRSEIELVYGDALPARLGRWTTFAAIVFALVAFVRVPVRRPEDEHSRAEAGKNVRRRVSAVALFYVLCGLLALTAGTRARHLNADATYLRGTAALDAGNGPEARELFRQARQRAPLSNTAVHSTYFEAVSLYREKRWAEAERVFRELVTRFPEAQAAAESTYHVGLCAEARGDRMEALQALAETERRFPGTYWANLAAERRASLRQEP